DAVPILAERDHVDFEDRPCLFDPCLGLDVTDGLGLQLVLERRGVELADHLPRLDVRALGQDVDDPGRSGLLLIHHPPAAAPTTAAATAATATATAASAAPTTTSHLVARALGRRGGRALGRRPKGHVGGDHVSEAADDRLAGG